MRAALGGIALSLVLGAVVSPRRGMADNPRTWRPVIVDAPR